MASTSDAPSRTILQELDDLFSWSPPRLYLNPNRTKSTATRRPTFFDKHFCDKAILKRVVHVPSLVRNLAEIVDSALEAAKPRFPLSTDNFITAKERKRAVERQRDEVGGEEGVAVFFQGTTGNFCPSVASTLLLHPDAVPEWQSLISFTSDVASKGYAIMDGEHSFHRPRRLTEVAKNLDTILAKMDSVTRSFVERMREYERPLTTFELKSLTVAPFEVMDAIIKTSEFSWEVCKLNPCQDPDHKKGRDQAAKIILGLDALNPPWNLLVCSYTLHSTFCSSYLLKAPQISSTIRSTTGGAGDAPPLATTLAMEQGEVSGHTGAGPSTMFPLVTNPFQPAAPAIQQSTRVAMAGSSMAAPSIAPSPYHVEERKRKSKAPQTSHSETSRTTRSATKAGRAPPLATALVKEPRRTKLIGMTSKASVHTGAGSSTMSRPATNPSEPVAPATRRSSPVVMAGPSTMAPSIVSNYDMKRKKTDSGVVSTESTLTPLSSEEPTPVKDKGKKRQRFDDASDPAYEDPSNPTSEDPSEATYEDPSDLTYVDPGTTNTIAHSFVQQVTP
jgi:hypothetical protein